MLRDKPESFEAKALAKKHEKALAVTDDEWRAAMDDAARKRWDDLAGEVAAVRNREPRSRPTALVFRDQGAKPAASWLFGRGDFHDKSTPVELGFVTVLTRGKPAADYWAEARAGGDRTGTTYQRRAAAWITDPDRGAGPLLARVIVNRALAAFTSARAWSGRRTTSASRGDRPSHPELLEWLAADLVAHGWKLKRLHRMILMSATYDRAPRSMRRRRPTGQPAPVADAAAAAGGRGARDAVLAVSGTLNAAMYGPAVKAPIPADAMVARNLKTPYPKAIPDTPAVHRRGVYVFHKRVIPLPLFQAFDAPDAQQCTGRRNVTTVAPQALALLNDPFVRARADNFADRLLAGGGDPGGLVDRAYRVAFGRPPTETELAAGVEFLSRKDRDRSARDPKGDARKRALTDYCQVLFGLNEFVYVD